MLIFRYTIFALISTFVNLFFQYISFLFYNGFLALYLAMFVGTFSGLIIKYVLDKKYIFFHIPESKKDDAYKFMLYSMMGVFTTFIFWGFEIAFHYAIAQEWAKYLGGAIGLMIGYVVKYYLDKKFVFNNK